MVLSLHQTFMSDISEQLYIELPLMHKRPAISIALGTLIGIVIAMQMPEYIVVPLILLCGLTFVFLRKKSMFVAFAFLFAMLAIGRVYFFENVHWDIYSSKVFSLTRELRAAMDANIDMLFPTNAAIVKGLLLGDKYEIPNWLYEMYTNHGVAHLFAVSGLHISILSGAVLKILRGAAKWLRSIILAIFLLTYVCLTGFSPSTIRASIMIAAILSARLIQGRRDYLSAFCISLSITLLLFPSSLLTASFLLSYGAMYGLLMLSDPISKLIRLPFKKVSSLLCGGIAVNFTLLPWFAYFFGNISATALPATLIILPFASVLIVSAMISVIVCFFSPTIASVIANIPRGMVYCINELLRFVDVGTLPVKAPNLASMALWFIGIFFLSPYYLPNSKKPPYLGLGLIAAASILWILPYLL